MRKYRESKTTQIIMATVPHITSGFGLRKFQADGFLMTRVYLQCLYFNMLMVHMYIFQNHCYLSVSPWKSNIDYTWPPCCL